MWRCDEGRITPIRNASRPWLIPKTPDLLLFSPSLASLYFTMLNWASLTFFWIRYTRSMLSSVVVSWKRPNENKFPAVKSWARMILIVNGASWDDGRSVEDPAGAGSVRVDGVTGRWAAGCVHCWCSCEASGEPVQLLISMAEFRCVTSDENNNTCSSCASIAALGRAPPIPQRDIAKTTHRSCLKFNDSAVEEVLLLLLLFC